MHNLNARLNKNYCTHTNYSENASKNLESNSTPATGSLFLRKRNIFSSSVLIPKHAGSSRYSLSNIETSHNTSDREFNMSQSSSGPLLASTRYNVNVGTYIDTQSPGLTDRIVRYNNENESKITHQSKYGTAGLFPVVHLFKKDLPIVYPKPKKVTVRMGPSIYNTPEHNRLLMESIVHGKNHSTGHKPADISNHTESENDIGTRSVLDALKEISRKRIHTSEDFDIEQESCKRQRSDYSSNSIDYNEHLIDKSNIQNSTSPSNSKIKCVLDPITASLSSSYLYKKQLERGLKRQIEETEKQETEQKQIKFANAETQTAAEKEEKQKLEEKSESIEITEDVESENITPVTSEGVIVEQKFSSPINILDDKLLEIAKKNKLSKLLNAFKSEDDIQPIVDEQPEKNSTHKPVTSILSPQNKIKHTKHVTFKIPNEISPSLTSNVTASITTPITSVIIEQPASAPSDVNSDLSSISNNDKTPPAPVEVPIEKTTFDKGTNEGNNFVKTPQPEVTTTSIPIQFNAVTSQFKPFINNPANTVLNSSLPSYSISPTIALSNSPTLLSLPEVKSNSNTSSGVSKMGGFKFDLNKPSNSTTNFTFTTAKTESSVSVPVTSKPLNFSFGDNNKQNNFPQLNVSNSFNSFNTKPSILNVSGTGNVQTASVFSIPKTTVEQKSIANTPVFNIAKTTTELKSTIGVFDKTKPFTAVSDITTVPFGQLKSTASALNVTSSAPISTNVNLPFVEKNSQSITSSTVTTASPVFRVPSRPMFPPSTNSSSAPSMVFGVSNSLFAGKEATPSVTTTSNSLSIFSDKSSLSAFTPKTTTATTSPFNFGTSSSSFDVNSGSMAKTNVTASTFGTGAVSSVFGKSINFAPEQSSAFTTKVSTMNSFPAVNTFPLPAANSVSTAGFSSGTITSNFSSTSGMSNFNSTPQKPIFGSTNPGTPILNQNTVPSFGGNTADSAFGSFGAVTTSAPAFNTFNTNNTSALPFGNAAFGKTANNAFNSPPPSFGNADKPSSFSNNSTTVASNPFGISSVPITTSVFAFGGDQNFTSKPAVSNSVFSFGSNDTSKSTNFIPGFGSNNAPNFGTVSSPPFGGTNTGSISSPSFGATNPPGFGANTVMPQFNLPSPGMFNIGSGPSTNTTRSSRSQIKTRRRNLN